MSCGENLQSTVDLLNLQGVCVGEWACHADVFVKVPRVQFSVRTRALTVQKTLWKLCCVWKSFCSEYQRIHCNTHTGERLHECDTHEKALSTHPPYIQPLTVHCGAKPCECSQCRKAFSYVSNLIHHQRVCSAEKPYTCVECGEDFWRQHQRTNSGGLRSG